MPIPAGPYLPTNELVAVAWLSQRVPGLAGIVATTLPRPLDGGAISWADTGFVQVQALPGGSPNIDVPVRKPVVQADCWAASATNAKPPWNLANRLAELIRDATENDAALYGKPVTLPVNYLGAVVLSAWLISEPMRITGDPLGYARFSLDLAIDWVRAP